MWIERDGHCALQDCISESILRQAREVADGATGRGDGAVLIGPDATRYPPLDELARSPRLKTLCRELYRIAAGGEALEEAQAHQRRRPHEARSSAKVAEPGAVS